VWAAAQIEMGPNFGDGLCQVLGFFFLHPYIFLPAPHNFLNPEIGLNILFEKGHHGYRK